MKKYPSISQLEKMFEVFKQAQDKGIVFEVKGENVFISFYDKRENKTINKMMSFMQAAIFIKDILETY